MDTASYAALRSPRADSKKLDEEPDRYARLAADTASAVARFHQSTRAIMQKMLVLGTAQDSAASRDALHALTDEGNALVGHVQRSLQELDALCDAPGMAASPRRRRRAQVDALASDFRSQCWNFEDTCRRLIDAERAAIAHIRQHVERREFSGDAAADAGAGASSAAVALDLANFNEEKRRHTDSYDDDASQNDPLDRRDHELSPHRTSHELHAQEPTREPSELVAQQQRDVVVEVVVKDAEQTPEPAASEGESRQRCCGCSRSTFVFLVVLVLIAAVLALVLGLQ